ncbi:amidase [Phreatobacter stygius]|uniref:Indoleacetamide hydrolase n=2 Tax=Phreatobacter stygius TaxID=1940610 RepID=A0A4D7BIG7_9HYPH|nr:amidase [Phreatobacter stygius]
MAGLAATGAIGLPHAAAGHDDDLAALDATAQADLVRRGEVKPAELLEAAIARIDRLNPALNAVVASFYERARRAAAQPLPEGPFGGVPYALKDLLDLQGTPRTAGSRLLARHVSAATSDIAARSMAAGLIVLGKTNTPEFALNASTEPLLFGPSRNPWNPGRSPGGSSGGAAAVVASGMLAMAHASDGGGSIRIPASCCGLFGLKPSRGRMTGSRQSDAGVDHCLSRSVRDSARLFGWNQRQDAAAPLAPVALGADPAARRLKIGFSSQGILGHEPAAAVKAALEQTARLCAGLGHQVVPARLPVEGELFFRHFMVAWSAGAARAVQQARTERQDPEAVLEPWTLFLAAHARAQAADAGQLAGAYFAEVARRFDRFFTDYDVMLTPVVDDEPPELGHLGPDVGGPQMWDRLVKYVAYTPVHNVAGTPAMSVPLSMSPSGLPIGSQFSARVGNEKTLFDLAFELEQASPWAQRRPSLR